MLKGAVGQIPSFIPLVALPIIAGFVLPAREFAVYAILNSVSTVALALDFGGSAYVAANAGRVLNPTSIVIRGSGISSVGSVLICGIAALLWIPYSATDAAGDWSLATGEAAIAVIALGSILRSATNVVAAAALARRDYYSRNLLLFGQALLAAVAVGSLLYFTRSAWSLPIGWLAGCGTSLAMVAPRVLRNYREPGPGAVQRDGALVGDPRSFAIKRTAATILTSLMLQGDRWALGAVAGPEFLAAYELMWRFASAPRVVAMSVSAVLVSDAKAAEDASSVGALVKNASRTTWLATLATAAGAVPLIVALWALNKIDVPMVLLGVLLTLALAINGRTAVTSMVGIGLGRPGVDLGYLSTALALAASAWIAGALMDSGGLLVIGSALALAGASLYFILHTERRLAPINTDV